MGTNQSQTTNVRFIGLVTSPNELTAAEGALVLAENVNIDNDHVVESRRGTKVYGTTTTAAVNKMFSWRDKLLLHRGSTLERDSDNAGTWTPYTGTFSPPTGYITKSAQMNRNFYFTSNTGIQKLDAVAGTPVMAGVPKGLDLTLTLVAGTVLANNMAVAYRIVWSFTDANANLLLGPPSQRVEISNTSGGARSVSLNFTIPSGITTAHVYQVYRSKAISTAVPGGPSDELQLAFEANPTAGEITAGVITVTDNIIEEVLSTNLYTNGSEEGIAQTNNVPPLAADITTFKNHLFLANTQQKQTAVTNILAVGATLGLQNGDTVTIAGVVLTGAAAENTVTGAFLVSTAPAPADAIQETSLSIVKVLNRFASNTVVNGFYGSGVADPPGQIIVERRVFSSTTFTITSSRTTAITPDVSTSDNQTKLNRVYISKVGRPEALPSGNFLDVGSADKSIERILALKDVLFVIKTDGVFLISGDNTTNFRVQEHDPTVFVRGRETAAVFSNHIYMMSNQGVVSIDENGVLVKSREIEDKILLYNSPMFATFEAIAHAVSYETDRKYLFFAPSVASDTVAKVVFVLNIFTGAWTTWTTANSAGVISTRDDKLYLSTVADLRVRQERKAFTLADHADDEFAVNITSFTDGTVFLTSTTVTVVGQTLKQGFREAVITKVVSPTEIKVDGVHSWTAGAATVFNPIMCKIKWRLEDVKTPGLMKQFNDVQFFFRQASFDKLTVGFKTSNLVNEIFLDLFASILSGWGENPWGEEPWGGAPTADTQIRTLTPNDCARGLWLILSIATTQAFTKFSSTGYSASLRGVSEKY